MQISDEGMAALKKSQEVKGSINPDKIMKAQEFLAHHDALYAEQMATVMDTITDGMRVTQEIAMRMSCGMVGLLFMADLSFFDTVFYKYRF